MEKVLTSKALWQNFDPAKEPLEANVLKTEEKGDLTCQTVYFTGRAVQDGKTRVLAKVYRKAKNCKNAMLVIDSYKKPINEEELAYWAENGFVAMAIDFAGRSTQGPCTLYPTSLDYCNADVAKSYYYIGENAKQTKLYEYALNCMRAVTYLLQEEKVKQISVLTVKKGSAVGIMVLGTDNRITNGTVVFGSLYREYISDVSIASKINELDSQELAEHVALAEKRQIWEAGIAPQSYAMQMQVPVYLIVAANSPHVSSLNANKMYYRMNKSSRMLMLPLSIDYMAEPYVKSIVNWCKGNTVEETVEVEQIKTDKGDNFVKINSSLPTNKLELWYSRNPDSRSRNWVKANIVETEQGCIAELDCYEPTCKIIAYAVAKGAVTISSKIEEVTVKSPSVVKTPTRKIFTGDGSGYLIPFARDGVFHGEKHKVEYCKGYLGIRGAKSTALATFALNDPCVRRKDIFTVSFDVSSETTQQLRVYIMVDFGGGNKLYRQTVDLPGDGKWQRITVEGAAFQDADGKLISEDNSAELLCFVADNEFIINNIFLV